LRDATRVAGANPRVWLDIFRDNRDELLAVLGDHRRAVEQLESSLQAGDAESLAQWISEAAANRRRVLQAAYAADPGDLYRVRVHVPDEPGVLAAFTQVLGAERINIEDFELHHLSPERGGVLGILVAGEAQAKRAAALLEAQGYGALVSPVAAAGENVSNRGRPRKVL
jgi:prephenate dehydrogenase